MNKEKFNKWITWFGRLLVLVSVIFLFIKLLEYKEDLVKVSYSSKVWIYVVLLSFVYGFLKFIPAYGWYKLLSSLPNNSKKLNALKAVIIYGKTHIAKYIPGNIFHYTGRHLLSKKLNLSDSFLIKTTFLEVFVVATIAASLSLFAFQEIVSYIELHIPFMDIYAWRILLISTILILFFFSIKYWSFIKEKFTNLKFLSFLKTYLLYFVFFILNFIVFYVILSIAVSHLHFADQNILFLLGAYSLAWFLGFIVPGAPGGIGVREAVLFAILNPLISGDELLFALILFRLLTSVGDLFHYFYTLVLEYYIKNYTQY